MAALRMFALAFGILGTAATAAQAGVMPAPSYYADALLDMGDGPYEEQANLTAGGARPWYESPVVKRVYGGTPDAYQRWRFSVDVFKRVEDAFHRSGLPLTLTNNPADPVPHAMSVVSNTYAPSSPGAVGIATINGSGFSFIDQLPYVRNAEELATAVGHNAAHELAHAFGGGHYDTTGRYLDAAVTDWETLINPEARFSPEAVAALSSMNFRAYRGLNWADPYGGLFRGLQQIHGPECPDCVGPAQLTAVPEPTTLGLWGFAAAGALAYRRRTKARRAV